MATALDALDRRPIRIRAAAWPGRLKDVDLPGLYAWWVDEAGALDLTQGIERPISAGRIYAGQAGATEWPSGTLHDSTLADRIGDKHLRGSVRRSTFRRSLAAAMLRVLDLEVLRPRYLDGASETRLSQWIRDHLELAIFPFPERDVLGDLENKVLAELDPPLNLRGMPGTSLRARVSELRKTIIHGAITGTIRSNIRTSGTSKPSQVSDASAVPGPVRHSPITLHDELVDIFEERREPWLATKELAKLVNERGNYRKKDGTEVTPFQIHGRTRNYPHLFDRDGSRVRLKKSGSR